MQMTEAYIEMRDININFSSEDMFDHHSYAHNFSLRKQPSFFAPSPSGVSRETPLWPRAKKDGCFHRLTRLKQL